MFEIGREYEFTIIVNGNEENFTTSIVSFESPLLKISAVKLIDRFSVDENEFEVFPEMVLNTHSSNFISAKLVK